LRRPIYNFAIDPELLAALRTLKVRDGIPESEQIRRGIRLWLKSKGVKVPPANETERQRGLKPRRRS
jgi:hypothetical protein